MDDRRTIAVVLVTSTLLTMLGIAGMFGGATELSGRDLPEIEETDDPKQAAEDKLRYQVVEAATSNPYRRPLAAANVFVSALVLIGSFMLSWRRKLAIWWIKQAVIAKLLWIVAHTYFVATHVSESASLLLPVLEEYIDIVGPEADLGDQSSIGAIVTLLILLGCANAFVHIAVAWRATRPDVKEFIAKSQPRF